LSESNPYFHSAIAHTSGVPLLDLFLLAECYAGLRDGLPFFNTFSNTLSNAARSGLAREIIWRTLAEGVSSVTSAVNTKARSNDKSKEERRTKERMEGLFFCSSIDGSLVSAVFASLLAPGRQPTGGRRNELDSQLLKACKVMGFCGSKQYRTRTLEGPRYRSMHLFELARPFEKQIALQKGIHH
jgi:hypothetical protein